MKARAAEGSTRGGPARERIDALADRVARLRRRILDPDVLSGILPYRLQWAQHRATLPEAVAREVAFRRASTAYATHCEGVREAPVHRVSVTGLQWSVPVTQPQNAGYTSWYAGKQRFPWRAIVQTREVSLGGVMLDIGANIGRMSVPRVVLGDVQAVYCAEPESLNYSCLASNVTDNGLAGLIMPDHVAIGAENGTVRLHRAKSAGGHFIDHEGGKDTIDVPCLTLDTWVDRLQLDPREVTFVKIDAQGCEGLVLNGAARVRACRHIAWQLEIDPVLLEFQGFGVRRLVALLAESFTHFIDLSRAARGARMQPTGELAQAVDAADGDRIDILAFNALGKDS
jgi:FkbM family methyltransferase